MVPAPDSSGDERYNRRNRNIFGHSWRGLNTIATS